MIKRKISYVFVDYVELDNFCHDLCIITNKKKEDSGNEEFIYEPISVQDDSIHSKTSKTVADPYCFSIMFVHELSEEERTKCAWCPEIPVLYSAAPDLPIQFKDKTAREMIQLLLANLDTIIDDTLKNN